MLDGSPRAAVVSELGHHEGINVPNMDREYIAECMDQGLFFSILEACHKVLQFDPHRGTFREAINTVLDAHRVNFQVTGAEGHVVPRSSFELHSEVIAPALQLIQANGDFRGVEAAYAAALKEIAERNPADAITDAGTALQEMFNALGVTGKVLGDQIKAVRSSGLLAGRDAPMLDAVVRALDWVAAERNQNGDVHSVTGATLDDAWLMVHVVGALIVRLAGSPRT